MSGWHVMCSASKLNESSILVNRIFPACSALRTAPTGGGQVTQRTDVVRGIHGSRSVKWVSSGLLAAILLGLASAVQAQDPAGELPQTSTTLSSNRATDQGLVFNFDRVPWRDVIKWLADQSQLALHFEDLPTGSFSYSDPETFSPSAAIDRVNLFLLPQGYALVRSGKLLAVINLGDPRSMKQLDALARLVAADQLDALPSHDVVKCLFPLTELDADEAVQEISVLELMTQPAVFEKTNQLMITDTVSKLRNVKAILDAFSPATMENGTVMRSFTLEHVTAEDILLVARPHLGLATGEMIGIDVSLSADLAGQHIFVTGVEDKVALIENLVQALDVADETLTRNDDQVELRSHAIKGGNVQTVYDVLQTLLAGESLRLSIDEAADSIVALASPEIQHEIEQTIAQLEASQADFEVIQLKSVDPFYAMGLLEQMLDLPSEYDDPDDIDPDAPRVDADPGNMRLYVRGKRAQIDQIKTIVAGLDQGAASTGQPLRLIPISSDQAEDLLRTAAQFWDYENPILYLPSKSPTGTRETERTIHSKQRRAKFTASPISHPSASEAPRFLTDNVNSQAPVIRCQLTPRGLLLQSADTNALDQFEQHLQTIIGGRSDLGASPPIVFYLKYTKPDAALRMLAELLDGGEAAREGEAGTLVNGAIGGSGSYLGSILTSREGTTTMIAGSITVVADNRLNRLIAQGTTSDIDRIESYLKIIDKDRGLTAVQTYGTTQVIELQYTRAEEVAETVRQSFAGRIVSSSPKGGAAPGGGEQREAGKERDKSDDRSDKKSGGKAPANPAAERTEPQITLAVHSPSNSLIITAPDDLLREVESLVKTIDLGSEQVVEVVSSSNTPLIESVLDPARRGSTAPRRSAAGGNSSGSSATRSRAFDYRSFSEALRSKSTR